MLLVLTVYLVAVAIPMMVAIAEPLTLGLLMAAQRGWPRTMNWAIRRPNSAKWPVKADPPFL